MAGPNLTPVRGRGRPSDAARADMADMEAAVIRDEARAHVARMRLSLQRGFWQTDEFRPVHKRLLNEVDAFARKLVDDGEGQAA